MAERIVLETYNEAFSKFPRGGKVSNEALTDSLVLFFRLGSEWQQEQSKNLYSEKDMIEFADFYYQYKELIKLNNWETIEVSKEDVFKKWLEKYKKK